LKTNRVYNLREVVLKKKGLNVTVNAMILIYQTTQIWQL